MLIGEYRHNLDSKGRLAIPAKLREQLKKGAVVTKGLDNCLFVFPKDTWEKMVKKLSEMPIGQSKARSFARFLLASAMEVDIDKQGRVNIPEYLRDFAGLDKETVITGLFDRLEIWDKSAWEKYRLANEKESNTVAEAMGELGV